MLSTKSKSASVVILTAGRIPRKDLARDICEMFHFVQHDKRGFGQQLYYCYIFFLQNTKKCRGKMLGVWIFFCIFV